jgi:hypothetical protein
MTLSGSIKSNRLFIIMQNVIMLSVVILNAIVLIVVMLFAIILSAVGSPLLPAQCHSMFMLSVAIKSFMLSAIILSVVKLNVVAPWGKAGIRREDFKVTNCHPEAFTIKLFVSVINSVSK